MSCLWTFGFWAIWEWVGAVKFESLKSNGVAVLFFPFDTIIWHIKKVRHKHMLEFPLATLIFGWIEALHFFLILLASDGVLRGGSDGVFPDLDQRHQWLILLEGTNVGLVEVRQCGWKIWRWGQLRSPHDSGKEIRSGYVCSSMLTRTNIRIIYNGPAFSHQIGIILCACVATACLVRILQTDHPRRNLDIWPPAARNVMWIHWSYCLRGSISSVGCLAKIHKDFHLGCC